MLQNDRQQARDIDPGLSGGGRRAQVQVALLPSLGAQGVEKKAQQVVIPVIGGEETIQIVSLQLKKQYRRVLLAGQHVRVF